MPVWTDGGDGVVGVEFGARTAVGVHVREDADGGGVAGVDEDDAVFVGGHGYGADLLGAEGYVQMFVRDGLVGLGVDDRMWSGGTAGRERCRERQKERSGVATPWARPYQHGATPHVTYPLSEG